MYHQCINPGRFGPSAADYSALDDTSRHGLGLPCKQQVVSSNLTLGSRFLPSDQGVFDRAGSVGWSKRGDVQRRDRHRVVMVLLSIAEDEKVHGMVRGGAAEAVSVWLPQTLRSSRRRTIPRLIGLLDDDSPDVRFWSAFSLGQLRAKQARTALRRLLTDDHELDGWWTISKEADAALEACGRGRPRSVRRPPKSGAAPDGTSRPLT